MLYEVPRWHQAVLIPRLGRSSRPVRLELRQRCSIELGHSRPERRRISLRERHDWVLPILTRGGHGIECRPTRPHERVLTDPGLTQAPTCPLRVPSEGR